jgi:putative ABC transport system permease protein
VRMVLENHNPSSMNSVSQAIERNLERQGISIKVSISEGRLDGALNGHVYILIFALIAMSVLMATVGILGLMSTMSTSVVERTREFGIMRTIGGQSMTVLRNVIGEGIFIGILSWFIAIVLSLPLSAFVGNLIGTLAFRLPLPLVLSPSAMLLWLGLIVVGSIAASSYPAWKASQLTIRETLAHV